jgi:predicted phosphodiesterase
MKIGIISDTHDNIPNIEKVLHEWIFFVYNQIQLDIDRM